MLDSSSKKEESQHWKFIVPFLLLSQVGGGGKTGIR
jgi:hypothetical protein